MNILVLSKGPSLAQCKKVVFSDDVELFDEIWGTNQTMFEYPVTLGFVMDDARERIRDMLDPDFYKLLSHAPVPYYTSKVYPEHPMAMEYPLWIVEPQVGPLIHHTRTTMDWLLAYAYSTGVSSLTFYGLDGLYAEQNPSRHATTAGWLMLLKKAGCELHFPKRSKYTEFLDEDQGWYGYAGSPGEPMIPLASRRKTNHLLKKWRAMQ